MRWEVPRTILGIVPIGTRVVEVDVSDVAKIGVGRAVRPVSILAGVAAIALPFLLGWGWWAALLVPMGLWIIPVALGPRMEAITKGGRRHTANVCFGHQIDADLYIAAIEDSAHT